MTKTQLDLRILFLFFGIHLALPLLVSGSILVPEILVSTFLLVTGYVLRVALKKRVLLSIASIAFISVFTILLSPDWTEHYVAHLRSSLNLIFSLLITLGFLAYLLHRGQETDISFNLRVFIYVALIASVLEIMAPFFAALVDFFRYTVFPVERIYTA